MGRHQSTVDAALSRIRERLPASPEGLGLVNVVENHAVLSNQLIKWYRPSNEVERMIVDSLVESASRAEKIAPGAFSEVVDIILFRTPLRASELRARAGMSRAFERADMLRMIENFDRKYKALLEHLTESFRMDESILVTRESHETVIIEENEAFVYTLHSPTHSRFDESRVRCVIVDGYIESVGEVHHLLSHANVSAKQPFVVFARGFHPDVEMTVSTNVAKKVMNLMLVRVPLDVDDANTLVDLAVIAGSDVVSSDKGQLISSIKLDELPILSQVTYRSGKIFIENSRQASNVGRHIERMRQKIEEGSPSKALLEGRISALAGRSLRVSIPTGKDFDEIERAVDTFLRTVQVAVRFGMIDEGENSYPLLSFIVMNTIARRFMASLPETILTPA